MGSELTTDYFQPVTAGGTDDFSNLVYACHACNEHKQGYWEPDSLERILHPLNDNLTEHVNEREDGVLIALTETGSFHIRRLHLNRSPLVMNRFRRRQQEMVLRRQAELEARLTQLETRLTFLESQSNGHFIDEASS